MTQFGEPARVLWVTEEIPDRNRGGGSIRQANLFRALAAEVPTELLVVGAVSDPTIRAAAAGIVELPPRTAAWTTNPIGRRALQLALSLGSRTPMEAYFAGPGRRALATWLRRNPPPHELVIVEHEALAPLVAARHTSPWMIEVHHLLSGMADQQARVAGRRQRWLLRWEARKSRRFEHRRLGSFDRVVTCSQEDADALAAIDPVQFARTAVIPNGVDVTQFPPTPLPSAPRILFPGTLGYRPNVDGATWFCREVMPRIRAEVPEATVELVGRTPVPEVLDLADLPGVSVEADVASMVPYFQASRVVVVPLRIGTGTRLKALEALAATRPLVGTTIGLEGIGITHGVEAAVADDAAEMARAIVALLTDDDQAARLATAGRAYVEAHFDWIAIGARFRDLVSDVLAGGAARSQEQNPVAY